MRASGAVAAPAGATAAGGAANESAPAAGIAVDDGYFPRGRSLLREVHEQRIVGVFYGQRALAVGALDPRNFVGTIQSTSSRQAPFSRLVRTANAFETVFFGTRAEADRMLARVDRMHQRVAGELPVDAGPWRAGTPLSAFDPDLMLWTVAVTFDSALCFYELFVRRLSDAERDALWQEYVRFGMLFGMPQSVAPDGYAAFRTWFDARLASDEMHLTEAARTVGCFVAFEIPMPWHHRPWKALHDLVMLGSFAPRVRELYGLEWSRRQAVAWRGAVALLRGLRRIAPPVATRGSSARSYALVRATERRRLRLGRPTPQVPAP